MLKYNEISFSNSKVTLQRWLHFHNLIRDQRAGNLIQKAEFTNFRYIKSIHLCLKNYLQATEKAVSQFFTGMKGSSFTDDNIVLTSFACGQCLHLGALSICMEQYNRLNAFHLYGKKVRTFRQMKQYRFFPVLGRQTTHFFYEGVWF